MWALLVLLPVANAFFFGGGGSSCGCGCAPPPPTPVCAPPVAAPCGCGGGASYGSSYSAPQVLSGVAGGYQQQAPQFLPGPSYQPAIGAPLGGGSYQQAPQQNFIPQQVQQPIYQQQAQPQPQQTFAQQPQAPPQGSYQEAPVQQPQAVQPAQQTQEAYQPQATEVQPAAEEQPAQQYREDNTNVEVAAAASKNAEVIEEAVEKSKAEGKTVKSGKEEKAEEKIIDISQLKLSDDPLCNSDDLRNLMLENMDDNLNSSKRLIQLASEAHFGGRFDVICANGDFSYVTNTELFCQETKGDVSCYTYRQL